MGLKIKKQSAALHEQPIDLFYEYRLEFDILAGGDACVPGRLMVRPGDRTSFIAGGDAPIDRDASTGINRDKFYDSPLKTM